jgi:hypothetical protein
MLSCLWSITLGRHLISCLFRREEYPQAQCVPRLERSPVRLLITSRDIQQPSGPSHHTTKSNKPHIPPAVYIYSGRTSSSALRTETRLSKRASHAARQISSLTSRAEVTICRSIVRHDGVFACATPAYISRQTQTGSGSGTSSLVACTILEANHAGAQSN